MIYFTSDTHFGQAAIIKLCRRPFQNVDEMNAALVQNWNANVEPNDTVWHLGDFAIGRAALREFAPQLNGRIHFVLGNHDDPKEIAKCGRFETVQDVKYLRDEGMRFWLSHYPHMAWKNSVNGAFHLFGHSHGDLRGVGRSMDVGVDANDYRPISITKVVNQLIFKDRVNHHGAPLSVRLERDAELAVFCVECRARIGSHCRSLRPQDYGRTIKGWHVKRTLRARAFFHPGHGEE